MFQQGEDPFEYINQAMVFLSAVASRFPPSNNQFRTSSNPRNQATIQDGRVTVQHSSRKDKSKAMLVQETKDLCTQPKKQDRIANGLRIIMLAEAHEASQILDEEQFAFLADPAISEAQVAQKIFP
ncbi:hypothetical protein Tco_0513893 [Tanacetum coccineum]